MVRRLITLANQRLVDRAIEYVREAFAQRPNSRVEIKGPKRSTDQNSAMWAKLTDIAEQLTWGGRKMTPDDFKIVMLDALRRHYGEDMRAVPNSDMSGWVQLDGRSSSDLTHDEMRDLLTIIDAFGDHHGVTWSDPKPKDMPPAPPVEAYADMEDVR